MPYHEQSIRDVRAEWYDEDMDFEPNRVKVKTVNPLELAHSSSITIPDSPQRYRDKRTTWERHRNKLPWCGLFVLLALLVGVALAVFYPKRPQVSLFTSSVLEIDGFVGKGCEEARGRTCRSTVKSEHTVNRVSSS